MVQKKVTICVVDGQGGGRGSTIVKRLKEGFGEWVEIIALGTNSIATAAMMKVRANRGATGENAIVRAGFKALALSMDNIVLQEIEAG